MTSSRQKADGSSDSYSNIPKGRRLNVEMAMRDSAV